MIENLENFDQEKDEIEHSKTWGVLGFCLDLGSSISDYLIADLLCCTSDYLLLVLLHFPFTLFFRSFAHSRP